MSLENLRKKIEDKKRLQEVAKKEIIKVDGRIYNINVKEEFLSNRLYVSSEEGTHENYRTLFRKTSLEEERKNKDLYLFSEADLDDLFLILNRKSVSTLVSDVSKIKNYISWAIETGRRVDKINPTEVYDIYKLENYVAKIARERAYVYSRTDLQTLTNFSENPQDSAIIVGCFEGMGREEIRKFEYADIDFDNNLILIRRELFNGNFDKDILMTIPEQTKEIFKNAIEQTYYFNKNNMLDKINDYYKSRGENSKVKNSVKDSEITFNKYLIRHVNPRPSNADLHEPINYLQINKRMRRLTDIFNIVKKTNDMKNITPTTLIYSGMMYDLAVLDSNGKEITLDVYQDIVRSRGMESFAILKKNYERLREVYMEGVAEDIENGVYFHKEWEFIEEVEEDNNDKEENNENNENNEDEM